MRIELTIGPGPKNHKRLLHISLQLGSAYGIVRFLQATYFHGSQGLSQGIAHRVLPSRHLTTRASCLPLAEVLVFQLALTSPQ